MRLKDLIEAELTPIKLLLDTIPPDLRQRAAAALSSGDKTLGNAWLQALGLELESLLLHLNAAVEGFLFLLATRVKGKAISAGYTKESRSKWLTDLETSQNFRGAELPGWAEVEKTRTESNLVKHRPGLDFAPGVDAPLSLSHVVQPTEEEVLSRFLGANQWLQALAAKCAPLDSP